MEKTTFFFLYVLSILILFSWFLVIFLPPPFDLFFGKKNF